MPSRGSPTTRRCRTSASTAPRPSTSPRATKSPTNGGSPRRTPSGYRRKVKDEAVQDTVLHVLPPCGGGARRGVNLQLSPISTFPHERGREI